MVWKCPPLNLFNWSNVWKWKQSMVKSPCIGKCNYDSVLEICKDCKRTRAEINKWSVMTDEQKLTVLERLLKD